VSDKLYGEGFWRAPRWLRRLLEDGELTPTEYGIVHYVAEAGGDRDFGYSTTYGHLAAVFQVHKDTIRHALPRLRDELELLDFKTKRGSPKPFRIRLGTRLRVTDPPVRPEVAPEVTSDATSDDAPSAPARNAAPKAEEQPASTSDATSDSRARAETERETETKTKTSVLSPDDALTRASGNGQYPLEGDARQALADLVGELDDADEWTFRVFAAEFSDLTAEQFEQAHDTLFRAQQKGKVEKSEAAYVYGVLQNIAGGYA
jgi:hypothetical protein